MLSLPNNFFNFSMMPKKTSPESSPPALQPLQGGREPRAHLEEVTRIVEEAERLRRELSSVLEKVKPDRMPDPMPDKINDALDAIEKFGINAVKWADGFTALHWAAENGRLEICKFLVSKEADPQAKDKRGRSPIDLAARGGHLEIVKFLKNNLPDEGGQFEGIPMEFVKALDAIKSHGWKSLKWAGGWSALHWAAQEGRIDMVRYLVDVAKAPAGLADKAGRSPSFYAQKRGHSKVVDFLNARLQN